MHVLGLGTEFKRQQMQQPILRVAETLIGSVEFGIALDDLGLLGLRRVVEAIGVDRGGKLKKPRFERVGVEPRAARFSEQGEKVRHGK